MRQAASLRFRTPYSAAGQWRTSLHYYWRSITAAAPLLVPLHGRRSVSARPSAITAGFIEVKTRGSEEFGRPESAVDAERRARLERAARDYLRRAGIPWRDARFDIVSIVLEKPPRIEWLRDAF